MSEETHVKQNEIINELKRIEEDAETSAKAHFNCSERLGRMHLWLGVPAIILSVIIGYLSLEEYENIAFGCSILIAVLVALLTFLRPEERSVKSKHAGDLLLAVKIEARMARTVWEVEGDIDNVSGKCKQLSERRNVINSLAPVFSYADYRKAKVGIDKGEAVYKVDQGGAP